MLGPMTTARKLEKQQGPESHGRDIDQMGAEDGPKGSFNNAAKAKQEGTGFWATPQGRRIAALEKRSQSGTAPKLGRIGTECGTVGGLQSQHQNLRAPEPGTRSRPGTRRGKTGGEIAPPARRIGVMTGNGKATGIAPSRVFCLECSAREPAARP